MSKSAFFCLLTLTAMSGCASGEKGLDEEDDASSSTGNWTGSGGATGGGGSSSIATGGTGGAGASGGLGGSAQGGSAQGGSAQGGSAQGGAGGQGGGGDTMAPTVISTTPSDMSTAIAAGATIDVTFSEPMSTATITADTTTACTGSVQLSSNGFTSCIAMTGTPSTSDDTTFTFTPAAPLDSAVTYRVRVTTAAEDAAQNALATVFTSANGFTTRYARTIVIDGTNDFGAENTIATSTAGSTLYLSYDDTHVYFGLDSGAVDVSDNVGDKFVHLFFSTDPTLATGTNLTEDGKAQFGATDKLVYHWKIQIDGGDYNEYNTANGTGWTVNDWGAQGKTGSKAAGYFEGSVELAEIGNPSSFVVASYTIDYDGDGGNGWLFNMLLGATDGTGATPRSIYGYGLIDVPTSNDPNAIAHLLTF